MTRKDYAILFFIGLAVQLVVAHFQSLPGYMDADYYFGGGLQLCFCPYRHLAANNVFEVGVEPFFGIELGAIAWQIKHFHFSPLGVGGIKFVKC